jgi:hypothetical protein
MIAFSCAENIKSKKLSEESIEKDLQSVRDSKQLSDDESRMLAAFIIRSKVGSIFGGAGIPKDKTIGQMIEEQRKWEEEQKIKEAEQKRIAEEAAREEARISEQLRKAVNVVLYKKSFLASDWQSGRYEDLISMGFVFTNLTEKDIRGFTGSVIFTDIFDQEIARTNLSIDEVLPAGKTVKWQGQRKYNQFNAEDKKLANTELSNLKVIWNPEKILFTDGTKIGKE